MIKLLNFTIVIIRPGHHPFHINTLSITVGIPSLLVHHLFPPFIHRYHSVGIPLRNVQFRLLATSPFTQPKTTEIRDLRGVCEEPVTTVVTGG